MFLKIILFASIFIFIRILIIKLLSIKLIKEMNSENKYTKKVIKLVEKINKK